MTRLPTLLGAVLALSCSRVVSGLITPEHFQFAQVVADDGQDLGAGWQAVCIKATLRDGNTGQTIICDFEVGIPVRTARQGMISRSFAQASAALAANNAAHILLSRLEAGAMLGLICQEFRPAMQAELRLAVDAATVTKCNRTGVPVVLFDGSPT